MSLAVVFVTCAGVDDSCYLVASFMSSLFLKSLIIAVHDSNADCWILYLYSVVYLITLLVFNHILKALLQ